MTPRRRHRDRACDRPPAGGDLGADRDPLLRDLQCAADRLRDEVRTLTDLADAVFGGTDRIINVE